MPPYTVLENGFTQVLPYNDYEGIPRAGVDKGFSVLYRINGTDDRAGLSAKLQGTGSVTVQITEGYCDAIQAVREVTAGSSAEEWELTERVWHDYWRC